MRRTGSALLATLCALFTPADGVQACVEPPAGCTISSHFGERVHPVTHERKFHAGADFACGIGTPVKAVESGVVKRYGFDAGGGNFVVVLGSSSNEFKYLHLSRFNGTAAAMQPVAAGQTVAFSGNTGAWTTGPHLHFETWAGGSKLVNPESLICGGGGSPSGGILDGEDPTGDPSSVNGGPGPAAPMGVDGSLESLLGNIIATRSLNPDYAAQLSTLPRERLYAELTYLDAASLRLQAELYASRERIEAMRALRQVLLTEQVLKPPLDRQRAAVAGR